MGGYRSSNATPAGYFGQDFSLFGSLHEDVALFARW